VLRSTITALAESEEMQQDKAKYENVCCTPELLVQIARTPIDFISPKADVFEPVSTTAWQSHNEIDEFLL